MSGDSHLGPVYVLVVEDRNYPLSAPMVYRGQSPNFNYIFWLGLERKRRQPILQVGIVVCSAPVSPFSCAMNACHLLFVSTASPAAPVAELRDPGIEGHPGEPGEPGVPW